MNEDTQRMDPYGETPHSKDRVLSLLSDPEQEQLLLEWLDSQQEFEPVSLSATIEETSFDICILDEAGFLEHVDGLQAKKEAASPVVLPYLLVLPEDQSTFVKSDAGDLVDNVISETVDEVLTRPVKRDVFLWRIESMLRIREQSLALRSRERELRSFEEAATASGHAFYITDREGTIEWVNPAFEEVTGYTFEEAVGETPRILKSGEMSEGYYEDLWETLLGGDVWEERIVDRRKNGELYHAHQTIAPIHDEDGAVESLVAIQTDISEKVDYERELERQRDLFERAQEIARVGAWEYDVRTEDGTWTDQVRRIHGLPTGATPSPAMSLEFFHPESRPALEAAFERAVEQGEPFDLELRFVDADGQHRWVRTKGEPQRENGEVVRVRGTIQDVTERKERERHLQSLVDTLPGIVYRCRNEQQWPMELVRGQCRELVGYAAEDIERGDVHWGTDVIHPDDRARTWGEVQSAVAQDRAFELIYRIQTADSTVKWVWERGKLVRPLDADSPRLEGFITDITERKELEENLRAAKERYESLFNSIRDAIVVADTDRRIVTCNPACTDLFGYELLEMEGEEVSMLYENDEEFETMAGSIDRSVGEPPVTRTAQYEKKSGQVFTGETSVFYLRDPDGETRGFIGLVRDVSDLQEKNDQMQVLDRVLRHNIRNDLNVIVGTAEVIRSEAAGVLTDYAATIIENANQLLETAEKEREITKLLTDPRPVEPMDLVDVLESCVADASERYPAATFALDLPDAATVDGSQALPGAIDELLTNAVEHSDRDRPAVEIGLRTCEDTVVVKIGDDGPGVPAMEQEVLAGEPDIDPLYHGSGLGLWLVYLVVQQSDGIVDYREKEPRGSVVTIELPLASQKDHLA